MSKAEELWKKKLKENWRKEREEVKRLKAELDALKKRQQWIDEVDRPHHPDDERPWCKSYLDVRATNERLKAELETMKAELFHLKEVSESDKRQVDTLQKNLNFVENLLKQREAKLEAENAYLYEQIEIQACIEKATTVSLRARISQLTDVIENGKDCKQCINDAEDTPEKRTACRNCMWKMADNFEPRKEN